MADSVLNPSVMAAFARELEKVAIVSRVGRGLRSAPGAVSGAALGSLGAAADFASARPVLAGLGAAGTGLGTYAGYKGLKGAKAGYSQHSYGAVPGTYGTESTI